MGRELKRVPLDFYWPLDEVWAGFVNPHYKECPKNCEGGYSEAYRLIAPHVNNMIWDRDLSTNHDTDMIVSGLLCGRPASTPFGHDSTDAYSAINKLGKLAGLPDKWNECPHCNGTGIDPTKKEAYEAWRPTEPPTGEGYQIWETVSKGSPVSPVFAEPERLAEWMVENDDSATRDTPEEQWLKFILGPGWAPSMVSIGGKLMSGVAAVTEGK